MKKTIIFLTLITAGIAKSDEIAGVDLGGNYLYTSNTIQQIANFVYLYLRGWGIPYIGDTMITDGQGANLSAEEMAGMSESLAGEQDQMNYSLVQRWQNKYYVDEALYSTDWTLPNGDDVTLRNYRLGKEWLGFTMADYLNDQAHGTYTNSAKMIDQISHLDYLLGQVISWQILAYNKMGGNSTNTVSLPSTAWKTWHNDNLEQGGGWFGLAPTISQLPVQDMLARMGWEQQVKDNLDSLAEYGLTVPELEDLLGQGWQGGQNANEDKIPQALLDKASKSLKFHVSMKAKTNALHAVLGFKGTNTLEDAVKKVVEEIKGVREGVSNIAEAGGLGGGGTNDFCCYFGLAWSNFQERTEIKLPPGVSSWDEFLRGWQHDMTQITESGDVRLRQWWGMMYTQTLLLDRQKREITGFGGMITRASNQTNAVDEIADKVQEDLEQADKWQDDLEGDIGRLFVSNVAPRVLEPMENFATGLRGLGQQKRLLKAGGNDEVVLLEWTSLGVRIAFDKSELQDVADTVRSFVRAFLYLLDAVIIIYLGIVAFRLVGKAYQFAHSCV